MNIVFLVASFGSKRTWKLHPPLSPRHVPDAPPQYGCISGGSWAVFVFRGSSIWYVTAPVPCDATVRSPKLTSPPVTFRPPSHTQATRWEVPFGCMVTSREFQCDPVVSIDVPLIAVNVVPPLVER